jgi:hypothetical protein
MKKESLILLLLVLFTFSVSAQQKEKIKGSKIVTITQKDIGEFENLEVSDNLEIFLIKGDRCGIEIEADDNLHDAIAIDLHGNTLQLSALKDVSGAKKFSVRITYTSDFKMVIAKDETNITALADITLNNFTFKSFDSAKIFANIKSKSFTLMANDKSKTELNLTGEQANIELSKNAQLKALIATSFMKFDMYQKTSAVIEGDVNDLKLRLDNNANFTGKNLTAKNATLNVEGYSVCSIKCNTWMAIEASGKAEIQLYGDQKIDLRKFIDNATLYKKPTK